jgi:hypothetical protein
MFIKTQCRLDNVHAPHNAKSPPHKKCGGQKKAVRNKLFRDLVDRSLQPGDAALSLTRVNHVLASGAVQDGAGFLQGLKGLSGILLLDGKTNSLDGVLDAGLGNTVAGATLQALTMPFQGRFVIGQGNFS